MWQCPDLIYRESTDLSKDSDMGRKSTVDLLPPSLKDKLLSLLAKPEVTQQEIADIINEEAGETVVSKSAVNRYAQKMEEFSRKNREATAIAKVYLQQVEDGTGNTLGKVAIEQLRMIVFDLLMGIDQMPKDATDPEGLMNLTTGINKVAKALRDLETASETNAKMEEQIKARTAIVAEEVEQTVKSSGLSDRAVEEIKAKILGIAE